MPLQLSTRLGSAISTPRHRHALYWCGVTLVTLLAALLRFWNLGHPQFLVFDESYYVKDAWTLVQNGYESTWPEGYDEEFARGETDAFSAEPRFAVHPPLGKWLIGIGMLFGADNAFWWRASVAFAGTTAVFVLMLVARRLLQPALLSILAGLFFAIDGHAIVLSRVALLDTWLMLFALLGFWFILLDRKPNGELHTSRAEHSMETPRLRGGGPVTWQRPWIVAAGLAFGAAAAVKWSGVWFIAVFGLYLLVSDMVARRRAGWPAWRTGAVLGQAPILFILLVIPATFAYLASWTGWFVTDGGFDRHWAEDSADSVVGVVAWVPPVLQNLWHYHQDAYAFHLQLDTPHPWQASPMTWLFMISPTMMLHRDVLTGCGAASCTESIFAIGNPLLWWPAAAATIYLSYRFVRSREWQVGAILAAVAAGYLPWLFYPDRTVFQFYSIIFQPYTTLALAFAIGVMLGSRSGINRRDLRAAIVGVYVFWVLVASALMYPLLTAVPLTPDLRDLLLIRGAL